MIVDTPPRSVIPACHNRPAFDAERAHFAINPETGFVEGTVLRNDWFKDRCVTWDGAGIGRPTPEYPSGVPYPIAHGFAEWCLTCKWKPDHV